LGAPGSGPIAFINGATPSGLTYTYSGLANAADDVAFSNNNGTSFDYSPTPDGDGLDANVTHVRINPKGTLGAAAGSDIPSFTLRLRVQVR